MKRKAVFVVSLMVTACVMGRATAQETTPLWKQFVKAKANGEEPTLPDFSFAGYHHGERAIPKIEGPIFDVTDFGAVPDDNKSDQAGLQKALDAAAAAGGGVVSLPPGRFLINTDRKAMRSLTLTSGNVVLRGSGAGRGGTQIAMVHPRDPTNPKLMYSTPYQIQLGAGGGDAVLTRVTGPARRETFAVTVEDASKLAAGQWVTLRLKSTDAVSTYLAPYKPQPAWTRMTTAGIQFQEVHRVASVKDNRVTFDGPIRQTIDPAHGWEITTFAHVEEVGVEDIAFVGGWQGPFIHHRSALDDSGYSALQLRRVINGWVRRCAFVGWNQCLQLSQCAYTSVLQVRLAGARGHGSIYVRGGGDGVLVGLVEDTSGHHHGPSVGYQTSGVVFWRYRMASEQPIDSHSGTPIATLLDRVDGGRLKGSGGPKAGLPNHLSHYVLWNFRHRAKPRSYDFWHRTGRDTFVKPIICGLHGREVTIKSSSVQVNESQNQPVLPLSLFEAQLELRLGEMPSWVETEKRAWSAFRALQLPGVPSSKKR
ncbi:MAG: DUF4955 domain-containing protein [Planctomycetota bacterium]|jgi:hypothetical protein